MNTKTQITCQLAAEEVLEWLKNNPEFLTQNAKILASDDSKSSNVTSLHAVKAAKAENNSENLKKRQQRLINTVEANSASASEIFNLIPKLIACNSLPIFRKFMQTTLKKDLALDATRLIFTGSKNTVTTMPAKEIQSLFENTNTVTLRTLYDAEDRTFYGTTGKMLKSDALLHLKNSKGKTMGLFILASKNEARFHSGQGQELITFFAKVASAVLEKCQA